MKLLRRKNRQEPQEWLEQATCPVCTQRIPVMYHFRGWAGITVHFDGPTPCLQREAPADRALSTTPEERDE